MVLWHGDPHRGGQPHGARACSQRRITAAHLHDKHPLPDLLHGHEQRVHGDSAHAIQKALITAKAPQARDCTDQRVRKGGEVDEVQRSKNRNRSKVRAWVEPVFAVVKGL